MVACGEGARFQRSLAQLAHLRGVLRKIEYVGDLDQEGLRIAVAAGRSALSAGLPEISRQWAFCTGHATLSQALRPSGWLAVRVR